MDGSPVGPDTKAVMGRGAISRNQVRKLPSRAGGWVGSPSAHRPRKNPKRPPPLKRVGETT
jgi:hypothetical protein